MILFLAFLFSLAVYLFVLGLINRRDRPLMVSGTWDFAGIIFAASGFLLLLGPGCVTGLYEPWRTFWGAGRTEQLEQPSDEGWYFSVFLSVLYFVIVVAGCALILWMRRRTTAIYNVEPTAFENVLNRVLEGLGLAWTRAGNQLFIKYAPLPSGNKVAGTAMQAAPSVAVREAGRELAEGPARERGAELAGLPAHPAVAHQLALLEVDSSHFFHHVTLRWRMGEEPLRQEVETELHRLLTRTPTRTNLIGPWLLTLSAMLFAGIFVGLVFLILLNLPRIMR